MAFDPKPGQELSIEGTIYTVAEHPAAPGIPFGQEGRAATVYKLETTGNPRALKVFKPRFRTPDLASLAAQIVSFASIPGLTVCKRSVLTPQKHSSLLRQNPDLTYSVLMPWIDGPTWLQVLQDKTPFSRTQSLSLSQALTHILSEIEQCGVAHCDLSAANLIIPSLVLDRDTTTYAPIELVDVEQIYAKNLDQPEAVPSGSDGYAHKSIRQNKIWNVKADRFAGAILLAEMLGWCDPAIRNAAWGESFFDPQELQRTSRRYDLLQNTIEHQWGITAAQMLERAWQSEILADCPTFGEWMLALPDTLSDLENNEGQVDSVSLSEDRTVITLLSLGNSLLAQGNHSGALEIYRKILPLVPAETTTAKTVQAQISRLERETGTELPTHLSPTIIENSSSSPQQICVACEKPFSIDTNKCPHCGKKVKQFDDSSTEENFRRDNHKIRVARILIILFFVILVAGVAGYFLKIKSGQNTQTQEPTSIAVVAITKPSTNTPDLASEPTLTPTQTIQPTITQTLPHTKEAPSFTPVPLEVQLTFGSDNIQPSFSPDGTKIVFTSRRDGNAEIYIMDFDGSNQHRLTNSTNLTEDLPGFTPDGKKIIFSASNSWSEDLYLLNLDGTDLINIPNTNNIREARPRFMSDSPLMVIFDAAPTNASWNVYSGVITANKLSNYSKLTPDTGSLYRLPSFLLNQKLFIVRREVKGKGITSSRVILHDLSSGEEKDISGDRQSYYPQASPDGKWVFFITPENGQSQLYRISTVDWKISKVPVDFKTNQGMAVSPDNRWLIISSNRDGDYNLYRIPFPD